MMLVASGIVQDNVYGGGACKRSCVGGRRGGERGRDKEGLLSLSQPLLFTATVLTGSYKRDTQCSRDSFTDTNGQFSFMQREYT